MAAINYIDSDEYNKLVELLRKNEKIKDYYLRMKEFGENDNMMEYNKLYTECINYQANLIIELRRSIRISKILNAKKNSHTTT